jgi:hypothetical protein
MGKIRDGIRRITHEVDMARGLWNQARLTEARLHWEEAKRLHTQYEADKRAASGKSTLWKHKKQNKILEFDQKWANIVQELGPDLDRP